MSARLPLEPLAAHIARSLGQRPADTSAEQYAEQAGVSNRTWARWHAAGGIDVWTADRVSCRLGLNACQIWDCGNGDWADLIDREVEQVEARRAAQRASRNARRPSRAEVMA